MVEDTQTRSTVYSLPARTGLPINRCNLPPAFLGSLTFQHHPARLFLDGIQALYGDFFAKLDDIKDAGKRTLAFKDFARATFFLDQPEHAGLSPGKQRIRRDKADYLRLLRGWMFNPDGQEAAVLKSWVESRFGLLSHNHLGPLGKLDQPNYQIYLAARSLGLYNTNALESQLDLLYTFCQYELFRQHPDQHDLTPYRGLRRLGDHEVLETLASNCWIMVLNNLNSFTTNPQRANEFGDLVIETEVPLSKILYYSGLLPDSLRGEQENLLIGGVYEVKRYEN